MADVGYAAVQIIPSTQGFAAALSSQLGGSVPAVGKAQGSKFGSALKVGALAAAAGVGAAVAGVGKAITTAAELDTKMREVVTLFGETGNVAEKSLSQVSKQVRSLSDQFGFAQQELTGGLYQAISAGVPRQNALQFMQVASKAAVAGVTDVETSVDGLSSIINAFGLEASDAKAVSDSMFSAVKGGKTTFEEISKAIFNVAPAAAAARVKMQEVNAAIATLTAGGTPTSVATTQIRAALDGLQKPSEDLDRIFGRLGFKNAQLAIESEGLGFALDAVKDASKGNNGELQKLLGSSEAVAAANVIAGTGARKFADEMRNQAKAAGSTNDAFGVVNKGLERQASIFKTQVVNVGISIGQVLLPVVNKLLKFLRSPAVAEFASELRDRLQPAFEAAGDVARTAFDVFKGVGKWMLDHTGTVKVLAGAIAALIVVTKLHAAAMATQAAVAAAMLNVAGAGGLLPLIKNLITSTKVWAAVTWLLNAAMTANPIGIVIAAVAALVAGFIVAWKKSETFRKIVKGALDAVAKAGMWLWEHALKPAFSAIGAAFRGIGRAFKSVWEKVLRPAFRAVVDAFLWVAEKIVQGAAFAFGWIPGIGPKLRTAADKFRTFRQNVNDALSGIKDKNVTVTGNLKFGGALSGQSFGEGGGANFARDLLLRKASGGFVSGPGGPRDDQIPARLSNGEFVVNAAATRQNRMLLEAINSGRGFKDGGLVLKTMLPGRREIGGFAGVFDGAISKVAAGVRDVLGEAMSRMVPSVSGVPTAVGGNAAIVKSIFANMFGWARYWPQTYSLLMKESGFRNTAQNPTSTAYGMFQFLDSTWGGYGIPKTSDPRLQSIAGGRYIRARYGNPAAALAFHLRNNWYDDGGIWPSGTLGVNRSGKPEAVFNDSQWKTLRAAVAPALSGARRPGRQRLANARVEFDPNRMEMWLKDIVVEEMADEGAHQNRFGD